MVVEVKIPSPGESISEVEIANWLVADGAYVKKDQEIAEIESDKATLPLVASHNGTVKIVVGPRVRVAVGAVACSINTDAVAPAGNTAAPKNDAPAKKETPAAKKEEPAKKEETVKQETAKTTPAATNKSKEVENVKVTPVAQSMMEENGLSVEDIIAGLRRITRKEVEAVMALPKTESADGKPAAKVQTSGALTVRSGDGSRNVKSEPMSPLRRKLSERLVSVKNETAMLTTFNEVDMSAVMALRQKYQDEFVAKYGIKLGLMCFFVKAASFALREFPEVNSMIDGDKIVTHHYSDIGIAVQSVKGLLVPVIRNTETLSLSDVELKIKDFAQKAKTGRVSLDEMMGGTFTITNGGTFGSLFATPIINPPQSGILGMHNIVDRPVAVNGQVVIRPMMYIALSYDHRIIDGKGSVSFLKRVKEYVENPTKMLLGGNDIEKVLLEL